MSTEKATKKVAPKKAAKKTAPKKADAAKTKAKSNGDENTVDLSSIATECKVDPTELRKALRGSKIKKPAGSWRWPKGHADIKAVKDLAKSLGK